MVTRLSPEARKLLTMSAAQEAERSGDRRLGTDHLLLALLHEQDSAPARALGTDLQTARAASDELDRAALAAVGVETSPVSPPPRPVQVRRRPLTSGARAVVVRAVEEARPTRRIESRHFLLALLARERPDPAAELLAALGVDRAQVRARLTSS